MKQKLLNLKSLLLLLLMTVSMGARAQAVYNSLSELAEAIEANEVQSGISKVSVSFNSVITEIRPERDSQSIVLKEGNYTFQLTANAFCDEGWTVGGKLATKAGKTWTAWYSGIYQPTGSDKIYMLYNSDDADAAWDNLTYTAPENYTLSGLAEAANAENVKNGEMVSVSLNNEITEIKFENQTQFVVVKDGNNTFQLTANAHCSTDWKVGGKLVGDNWIARYLGSYSLNGVDRIHMLYNNTDAAWAGLTYTAPENYTLSGLAEAANAENVKNGEMVSVSLNNEITEIKFENQTQFVVVKDGDYTFQLTANAHCSTDWKVGGKLVGDNWIARYLGSYSLNGVDRIHMLYNNTDAAWAGLTYTAPENYTLSGLAGAANAENVKNGEMVSVSLNNEITEIKFENQTQFVVVKDGNNTFQLTANAHCSTDWKVGGKLVGDNWIARYLGSYSLNGVDRIHMLYNNADDAWAGLTYTAPVAVTVNDCGNASFSCGKALDFTNSAVKAYMITAESAESVTITEIKKVPAYTGIFVVGEGGTYNIPVLDGDADDTSANLLEATITPKAVIPAENIWALSKNDGKLHPVTSGTIGTGKAYFVSTINNTAAARGFVFVDDENTTGINSAATVKATGVAYNLAGQRVNANAKGIVIVNGKKFINK